MAVLDRLHAIAQKLFLRGKREGVLPASLNVRAAARIYLGGGHTVALMQFAGAGKRDLETLIEQLVTGVMGVGVEAARR
jgi:TetR/AcrR family hemagglutinin/protease transcriptional regulator